MQKITVLCVGKLKEAFYEQAVKEYEKRLSRCCKLELLELPEQRLGDEPSEAEIRQAREDSAENGRLKELLGLQDRRPDLTGDLQ